MCNDVQLKCVTCECASTSPPLPYYSVGLARKQNMINIALFIIESIIYCFLVFFKYPFT